MTSKRKREGAQLLGGLGGLVGVLLLIPSCVLAIFYFFVLKIRYLRNPSAQRIVDTPRMLSIIGKGGITVFVLLVLTALTDVFAIFVVPVMVIYIFRIPVFALGIIADNEKDKLYFPCDMQSYTLVDYVIMRFIKDACSVDSVHLSEITKLTRGYGKDLYVHGKFGSRKITMSSKQKRDECLAMIQSFCGRKGILASEIESY